MPVDLSNVTAYSGDMLRIISDAELSILRRLAARLRAGRGATDWEQEKLAELRILRRQISQDVAAMDAALVQEVDRLIEAAYQDGAAAAGADLRDAGVEPRRAVALPASVQVLADELSRIVSGSAPRILRSVTDAYQQAVAAEIGQLLTGTVTRTQSSQAILDRLLGQGITSFTDRSGRQWRLESYVEMATRTAAGNAMTAGHADRLTQNDVDLVHIIPGPRSCSICDRWGGEVVALTEAGKANPDMSVPYTLDDARSAGWQHPNCRCSIGIYIPGVSRVSNQRPDPQGYADQQQQRALERDIRAAKREQALALDSKAAQRANAKVREAQANLRDHLSAHPDLKRQSHRESLGLPSKTRAPRVTTPRVTTPRVTTPRTKQTLPVMRTMRPLDPAASKLPTLSRTPDNLRIAVSQGAANPKNASWLRSNRLAGEGSRDYSVNCTRVSAAAEMRRRGYDVTAAPVTITTDKSDSWMTNNWIDPATRKAPVLTKTPTAADLLSAMEKEPDGARFFVVGPWKTGGAHIWNAEKINGKITFVEGQIHFPSGQDVTSRYLKDIDFDKHRGTVNSVRFMRVDHLQPSSQIVHAFER